VGWGRKGRGTEREGNGAEGKKGGKGGGEERERDGREMEGTGIGGGEVCVMVFGGDGRPWRKSRGDESPMQNWQWGTLIQVVPQIFVIFQNFKRSPWIRSSSPRSTQIYTTGPIYTVHTYTQGRPSPRPPKSHDATS
jgi:hypothetical protein